MKRLRLAVFALALSASSAIADPGPQDADFDKVADEYIRGWLAAHPITATQLGIHDFDGRISDFTAPSPPSPSPPPAPPPIPGRRPPTSKRSPINTSEAGWPRPRPRRRSSASTISMGAPAPPPASR